MVAIVVPLTYATTRIAWFLGYPLGVGDDMLTSTRDILGSGLVLALMAIGGALLTTGLVLPWGERWPRWFPSIGGRPVPVAFPTVWALTVAVMVASAGSTFITGMLDPTQQIGPPGARDELGAWLPLMAWPLWGAALAVCVLAYGARRAAGSAQRPADSATTMGR